MEPLPPQRLGLIDECWRVPFVRQTGTDQNNTASQPQAAPAVALSGQEARNFYEQLFENNSSAHNAGAPQIAAPSVGWPGGPAVQPNQDFSANAPIYPVPTPYDAARVPGATCSFPSAQPPPFSQGIQRIVQPEPSSYNKAAPVPNAAFSFPTVQPAPTEQPGPSSYNNAAPVPVVPSSFPVAQLPATGQPGPSRHSNVAPVPAASFSLPSTPPQPIGQPGPSPYNNAALVPGTPGNYPNAQPPPFNQGYQMMGQPGPSSYNNGYSMQGPPGNMMQGPPNAFNPNMYGGGPPQGQSGPSSYDNMQRLPSSYGSWLASQYQPQNVHHGFCGGLAPTPYADDEVSVTYSSFDNGAAPGTRDQNGAGARRKRQRKKIDVKDAKKFFHAASTGDGNTVEEYLGAGMDVDMRDRHGMTALMYAAIANHMNVCKILVSFQADTMLKTADGMNVFNLLKLYKNKKLSAELQTYIGDLNTVCKNGLAPGLEKGQYCDTCQRWYMASVSIVAHETSMTHILNSQKLGRVHSGFMIPMDNKGYKLLRRGGWTEEKGLGKDGEGNKFPIRTILKTNRSGLGMEVGEARVTHNQRSEIPPDDFEGIPNGIRPAVALPPTRKTRKNMKVLERKRLRKEKKREKTIAAKLRAELECDDHTVELLEGLEGREEDVVSRRAMVRPEMAVVHRRETAADPEVAIWDLEETDAGQQDSTVEDKEDTLICQEEAMICQEYAHVSPEDVGQNEAAVRLERALWAAVGPEEAVESHEESMEGPEEVVGPECASSPGEAAVVQEEAAVDLEKAIWAAVGSEDEVVRPKDAAASPEESAVDQEETVGTLENPVWSAVGPEEAIVSPEETTVCPEEAVVCQEEAIVVPEELVGPESQQDLYF